LPARLGRLRRAVLPLLPLAVLSSALAVPAATAAEGPSASFDYTMPDRFGLDENADGLTDYVAGTTDHPGSVEVDPATWHVDLDACASTDGAALEWRVVDQPDEAAPLTVTKNGDGCDDFDLDVPDEGTYRVELTATKDGVSSRTTVPVVVQDWLIVSLGDSYGSGEGVPDIEIPQDEYTEFLAAWRDFDTKLRKVTTIEADLEPFRRQEALWREYNAQYDAHCLPFQDPKTYDYWDPIECAKVLGYRADRLRTMISEAVALGVKIVGETFGDVVDAVDAFVEGVKQSVEAAAQLVETFQGKHNATWQDRRCHRSAYAGSAQAAKRLEQDDPRTSVTFVHLACSGASVVYGLLGRYTGVEKAGSDSNEWCNEPGGPFDPAPPAGACIAPQIDRANQMVGDREIDAVYISIGGNDAHFADIVVACMSQNPCYQENWLSDNEAERARTCKDPVWLDLVPGFFCHKFFDLLPDYDEDGNDVFKNAAQLWQEGKDGVVGDKMFKGHVTLFRDLAEAVSGSNGGNGKLLDWKDRNRVFLSEYVDATQDTDGTRCGDPKRGIRTIPGFSQHEFQWIADTVAPELNRNVEAATAAHGWTLVDGIYEDFAGHGYCADDNYLVRLQESFLRQGNKEGTVHPNVKGHAAYADNILREWKQAFYGSVDDLSTPRRPDQLAFADAGGPYTVAEGSTVPVEHDSVDHDGDALGFEWAVDQAVARVENNGERDARLVGIDDGETSVDLRLHDQEEGYATDTTSLTVTNVAPAVAAGADAESAEGSVWTGTASVTDPGTADTHTAVVDFGDGTAPEELAVTDGKVALSHRFVDDGRYDVQVEVTDDDGGVGTDGLVVTVSNAAPAVEQVVAPLEPQQVGTEVVATAGFSDAGTSDVHTATVDWGDGSRGPASVTEDAGAGEARASHAYTVPGTYRVTVTVDDADGGVTASTYEYVVVYDPSGGFVTGGGLLDSPAGAYRPDPSLTGTAHFAFVSKYSKGATVPTGSTSFRFTAGKLELESKTYQWLVVAGARAQYKGTGTVNGVAGHTFTVTAVDGDKLGKGKPDLLRVQIWAPSGGPVYDNQSGAPLDADPIQAIAGGQVQVQGTK
jgi:PKD repeat protein